MPKCQSGRNRHIQRMLSAMLRNFKANVTFINDFLLNTIDFVSYYDCIFFGWFNSEILKFDTPFDLLKNTKSIIFVFQPVESFNRI